LQYACSPEKRKGASDKTSKGRLEVDEESRRLCLQFLIARSTVSTRNKKRCFFFFFFLLFNKIRKLRTKLLSHCMLQCHYSSERNRL
jgi:hypothetical protein